MFTIKPNPTFVAAVQIPVPGGEKAEIRVTYKHKNREALSEFSSKVHSGDLTDVQTLMSIVDGWDGVKEAFSEQAVTELVQNYHSAAPVIYARYFEEIIQAKKGN